MQAEAAAAGDTEEDVSKGRYGDFGIVQSKEKLDRKLIYVKDLTPALHEQKIWTRGRLHNSRAKGKAF